uniref:Uncharacterized protein n=1 Tax=Salix viminalis TaxID=40686 RepID=A0A6N2M539_SALVM
MERRFWQDGFEISEGGNGRLLFPAVRSSMEEETVSLILNGKTSIAEEFSDSNSSAHPFSARTDCLNSVFSTITGDLKMAQNDSTENGQS